MFVLKAIGGGYNHIKPITKKKEKKKLMKKKNKMEKREIKEEERREKQTMRKTKIAVPKRDLIKIVKSKAH